MCVPWLGTTVSSGACAVTVRSVGCDVALMDWALEHSVPEQLRAAPILSAQGRDQPEQQPDRSSVRRQKRFAGPEQRQSRLWRGEWGMLCTSYRFLRMGATMVLRPLTPMRQRESL